MLVITLVQMFVVVGPVLPWFLPSFLHKTEFDCLAFLRNICCSEVCWGRTEIDRRDEFICCVLYGTCFKSRKQLQWLNITVLDIRLAVRIVEATAFPVCSELWRILILWFLRFQGAIILSSSCLWVTGGIWIAFRCRGSKRKITSGLLRPSHPLYCQCCANMKVRGEVFLRKCLRFHF